MNLDAFSCDKIAGQNVSPRQKYVNEFFSDSEESDIPDGVISFIVSILSKVSEEELAEEEKRKYLHVAGKLMFNLMPGDISTISQRLHARGNMIQKAASIYESYVRKIIQENIFLENKAAIATIFKRKPKLVTEFLTEILK